MKKVIYIALVGAGLFTVSCSKQNIKPNSEETTALPVWKSAAPAASTSSDDTAGEGGGAVTSDGAITDPNSDKDENIRKKH
jgi:PBP1b-binding outer membrane lipoprotein LpoB